MSKRARVGCIYNLSRFDKVNMKRVARGAEKLVAKSPFYETRDMFRESTGYTEPLSYEKWVSLDPDYKAAVLFLQFFDQITLAWYKAKSYYALEEDGVSTCLQYLQKNVPVIEGDKSRFTPAYIYRVSYNCMYCICHDIKIDRERYENETSNVVVSGEDELDLFDLVPERDSIESTIVREHFWKVVFSLGPDAEIIVDHLLNGTRLPAGYKAKKSKIISDLRDALNRFEEDYI